MIRCHDPPSPPDRIRCHDPPTPPDVLLLLLLLLLQDFAVKAESVCGKDVAALATAFPGVQPEQAPYFCLDLAFCHTMLTKGFQVSDSSAITLVKQIEYNGSNIEAAWPLGAAIDDLS